MTLPTPCNHLWILRSMEDKKNPWGYDYVVITYCCSKCLTIKEREEKK